VAAGYGYGVLPLLGAAVAVVALGLTVLSYLMERQAALVRV